MSRTINEIRVSDKKCCECCGDIQILSAFKSGSDVCMLCEYVKKRQTLPKKCVTCHQDKMLDEFEIEEGTKVVLPLDSYDLEYLDEISTQQSDPLQDEMSCNEEREYKFDEDELDGMKLDVTMAGNILKAIHTPVARNYCVGIPFNDSQLRWLEIELLSQVEQEAHLHKEYVSTWPFAEEILRTISIYTVDLRKSECNDCVGA
jgi:hypothetical protein